jgi:hypothetical protein
VSHGADVTMSLLRLRSEIAAVRVLKSAAQVALLLKSNFNPNQPRVPAGNPDGGQWTRVGGSSSEAGTSDETPPGGPLRITVRPRGIGDNGGPPLELPPTIPANRPPTRQEENRIARAAVRWLARAALRQALGPVGTYLTIVEAATWLHEHLPNMQSYFDSPKTLGELRDAAREPKKGLRYSSYRRAGVCARLRLPEFNDQRAAESGAHPPLQALGDQCVVWKAERKLWWRRTARVSERQGVVRASQDGLGRVD